MNQDVLDMIARLHARLDDLTAVVNQCDMDLEGYAKRLDKVDDQIYLIEVELEKRLKHAHNDDTEKVDNADNVDEKADNSKDEHSESQLVSDKAAESESRRQIISDDMKENFGDATRALGAIYRDGKEAVSELTDAMSDIKSTFDFKGKAPRRRRR